MLSNIIKNKNIGNKDLINIKLYEFNNEHAINFGKVIHKDKECIFEFNKKVGYKIPSSYSYYGLLEHTNYICICVDLLNEYDNANCYSNSNQLDKCYSKVFDLLIYFNDRGVKFDNIRIDIKFNSNIQGCTNEYQIKVMKIINDIEYYNLYKRTYSLTNQVTISYAIYDYKDNEQFDTVIYGVKHII